MKNRKLLGLRVRANTRLLRLYVGLEPKMLGLVAPCRGFHVGGRRINLVYVERRGVLLNTSTVISSVKAEAYK